MPEMLLAAASCSWQLGLHGSRLLSGSEECSPAGGGHCGTRQKEPCPCCSSGGGSGYSSATSPASYPGGRRLLGTFVLRVQIAWLLCAALALQEVPMACRHRSRGGWCSVISAYKVPGA